MKLQGIQSNHAFTMLKTLGYKPETLTGEEIGKLVKKLGFKIVTIKKDKYVGTALSYSVDEAFEKKAKALGISKSCLMREMITKYVDKKSTVL